MEGDCAVYQAATGNRISIHSLRMEGDNASANGKWNSIISIHSLRMEGDDVWRVLEVFIRKFQSTPSAWRETLVLFTPLYISNVFQSTPSAWRETFMFDIRADTDDISIHSLRMEGD